mmetsp:Transcript_109224/g.216910  ORF Transcript_109224/g.216910 Transcript_109224/m.216910 type:complete len:221 (+) Transcript_109224:57-719(+)
MQNFGTFFLLCTSFAIAARLPQLGHLRGNGTLGSVQRGTPDLSNSSSTIAKQHLHAWLVGLLGLEGKPLLSEDPNKCADETAIMLEELRYAYSRRMVPEVLRDECKHFIYYENFGKEKEVCEAIVEHLINTMRGDKDYKTWCRDVYSKRHAENAHKIPIKEDPGPRKGKYADVEEFSFPNDADPHRDDNGAGADGNPAGDAKKTKEVENVENTSKEKDKK